MLVYLTEATHFQFASFFLLFSKYISTVTFLAMYSASCSNEVIPSVKACLVFFMHNQGYLPEYQWTKAETSVCKGTWKGCMLEHSSYWWC